MIPARVKLVEVGPRDGLQNEPGAIPTATKVALIEALGTAGLRVIEAGSFVSPKWVPQMADTAAVLAALTPRPGVSYPVLVPNRTGLDAALAATGVEEIAVFGAASESFSRRNTNCSIDEGLGRFADVVARARDHGLRVRGYVSCVLGCPYEGAIAPAAVARVAGALFDMGCYEVSLGDTIGTGTPAAAQAMVDVVAERVPRDRLAAHFHDTYGQALANILAVMDRGIAVVDASVAGLGGCPYAKGASGNVATEDVLYMLDGMGIETGVDMAALLRAGTDVCRALGREPASKAARALAAAAT
ncbi:hydroxymethylglutaryl-CoA lyase [Roseospira marina]|uniref:hydroxymethylglutaryl-CoA lyase n=1 Tax=Roseospira marina TaxID=140057 RepID=A0A5M6IGD1_9PROT|nr:hydroxymethylglutaryl-CoA lyase [Roseospira marina]KAA5606947.1 hydroxymethylglutaryl-CoA lyase [Roseospira marina]MBB4312878.1 hydroxymethylglutaryl-CoA lyase [Roseospira marina]MBB5086349.1 hydroxymethylglutaryl-CoA lyase [Roseospira marina]